MDRKRREYENDLHAVSSAYEKNLIKARDEIARVKGERDDLVMKVCEFEKNHEYFKRQVFIDAQQKLANSCQKAVTEFSGGVTSGEACLLYCFAKRIKYFHYGFRRCYFKNPKKIFLVATPN